MKSTNTHSGDDRTAFDLLLPEEMLWVNQCCDKFEKTWRNGEPSLSSFLGELDRDKDQPSYVALCLELIAIDIQHRLRLGLDCSQDFYTLHFKNLGEHEVTRVYHQVVGNSPRIDDSGPLRIDQQLGDYVVKALIGSGGMGAVYRAEHGLMGRQVAIKVLSGRTAQDSNSRRRFLREVRALAKLSHSNIISAFDARIDGELLYLVTEWVHGENLAQRVSRTGPFDCREALKLVLQAARGLHYAHAQGVIHRDVKPSNLLLDQHGIVKVLDLGLSRLLLDNDESTPEALTQSMHLLGTVAYMSPEQARSPLDSDQRSDIYSLGCTLFFLLTGKAPFSGETNVDVLFSHARDPIPNLRESCNSANSHTEKLVQLMLAKEPSDRPANMLEVAQEIERILAHDDFSFAPKRSRVSKQRAEHSSASNWSLRTVLTTISIVIAVVALSWIGINMKWANFGFQPLRPNANDGFHLNGVSDFGQILDFDVPVPNSALIEAAFTAGPGAGPANLVTWTGDRIFGLFIDQNNCWGVSFADSDKSYVSVSNEKAVVGKLQLIAARYEADATTLYIDGRRVATTPREYRMVSSSQKFCFGGLPTGLLPLDEGTRFLSGTLHRLRISSGILPKVAITATDLVKQPSTIALLQFSDLNGSQAVDESERKWRVQLSNVP